MLGDEAPGSDGHVFSNSFNPPSINNQGDVAFNAYVNDLSGDNRRQAIFKTNGGVLESVAYQFDIAPGSTKSHRLFSRPTISGDGDVAFSGWLNSSSTTNSRGVWAESSGVMQALSIHSPSETLRGLALSRSTSAITLDTFGNVRLSTGPEAAATILAETGSSAAGINNASFSDYISSPTVNDAGMVAFSARVDGAGITSGNNFGVWVSSASASNLIARTGDNAAGTTEVFSSLALPSINAHGDVVFAGETTGDVNSNAGVWKTDSGAVQLLAKEGELAPGGAGATFRSFSRALLNINGQASFRATLNDGREGLWMAGAEGIEMVALQGAQLEGLPPGATVDSFLGGIVLNAMGQIAFSIRATGTGENDDRILYVRQPSGNLMMVARRGMTLDLLSGESVTISATSPSFDGLSGNSDGILSGFNDQGQIAFSAFTDQGNGIFIASIRSIPEPTSLCMTLSYGLFFCFHRRPKSLSVHNSRSGH